MAEMYTKKQKALFSGLCYTLIAWLCAFMIGSIGIAGYIRFIDSEIVALDTALKAKPFILLLVGVPAFMIGYSNKMHE